MAFTINLRKSFDNVVCRLSVCLADGAELRTHHYKFAVPYAKQRISRSAPDSPSVDIQDVAAGGCQTLLASWRKTNRMSHIKRLNIAQMSRIRHVCRWTSTRITRPHQQQQQRAAIAGKIHWQLINPALGRVSVAGQALQRPVGLLHPRWRPARFGLSTSPFGQLVTIHSADSALLKRV